ncbi:MAG: DJ-1 family glyoxalase III [Thermodesulfovibrionales bacterium]
MPRVVVPLADGFEEVEAMAIVDVLRRADIDVVIAGLHAGPIESARRVRVLPDTTIDTIREADFDMIVLPGGQPGSDNLNADPRVKDLLRDFYTKGKLTGAICAAPYILASAGILEGKRVTSYPTYRDRLGNSMYEESIVVEDANIVTSKGPGTALHFGLAIVEKLKGKETAIAIKEGMLICD